jgi:hypothetical protein
LDYEESVTSAARLANEAVWETMSAYRDGTASEEPAITGALVMALRKALSRRINGLRWSAHILKASSAKSAEEDRWGADILFHVAFQTPRLTYSKGVLVQAKRREPHRRLNAREHQELVSQCNKMLGVTPASFVFDYTRSTMRCGSAVAIAGSTNRELYGQCVWTAYRFFLELFRCPIGDPRITSAYPDDLPVPYVIRFEVNSTD